MLDRHRFNMLFDATAQAGLLTAAECAGVVAGELVEVQPFAGLI